MVFGAVSTGGSIFATNAGTFPTPPMFRIDGPVTNLASRTWPRVTSWCSTSPWPVASGRARKSPGKTAEGHQVLTSWAQYDQKHSLEGQRVRLVGFVVPDQGDSPEYQLTRFTLACCAADAEAYSVAVRGDTTPRQADQWLLIEGHWLPQPVPKQASASTKPPVLIADSVTTIQPPTNRYENTLFNF
jgi:uncharacterized repeat protein (TIGR03943 family)